MSMSIIELNKQLAYFNEEYIKDPMSVDFNTAAELHQAITSYYAENPQTRYASLSQSFDDYFTENSEIDTVRLYEEELALSAHVARFKDIIEGQKELLEQLQSQNITLGNKIKILQDNLDEKNKTLTAETAKKPSDPVKIAKLEQERDQLQKDITAIQAEVTENETKIVKLAPKPTQSPLKPNELQPTVTDFEELNLVHSIMSIYEFPADAADAPKDTQELLTKMKAYLEDVEANARYDKADPKLIAMKELYQYYEAYAAKTEKAEAIIIPDIYKVKSIQYALPQQYQNAIGKGASITAGQGTSFEMPMSQRIACPKSATMNIEFENGAKLSVTPGPKPELFLPAKINFNTGDKKADDAAFKESIKIFAEQYLSMRNGYLVKKVKLEFNGPETAEQKEIREEFVKTLLDKKVLKVKGVMGNVLDDKGAKKIGGNQQVMIDQEAFQEVYRATKDLFPDGDTFFQEYLEKHGVKSELSTSQKLNQFLGYRKGEERSEQGILTSSDDMKGQLRKSIQEVDTQKRQHSSIKLLEAARNEYEDMLRENPDPNVLGGHAKLSEDWQNTAQTLGSGLGYLSAYTSSSASAVYQSAKNYFNTFGLESDSRNTKMVAQAIGILASFDKPPQDNKTYARARDLVTELIKAKYKLPDNAPEIETKVDEFIKARIEERKIAQDKKSLTR